MKNLSIAVLLLNLLSSSMIFGQRRSVQAKPNAQKCSGGWTGTVKYTPTQTNTGNKTKRRASMMGEETTNREMKYEDKAKITDSENAGSARAKAVNDSTFAGAEKTSAKVKLSCEI